MAIHIIIPRLGWSMDEGIFAGWLKADGDSIRAGDPLFTLQGEKATQDVEAIDEGVLKIPATGPLVGETVLVGAIIGYLVQAGESLPGTAVAKRPDPIPVRSDEPKSSPLARRIAREHGIDWTKLVGSGSSGRIRRADVLKAIQSEEVVSRPVIASPGRRVIAARMEESRRTTVPVTLTTTADVTNLVGLRRQFKAAEGPGLDVPSFMDFTVKLTALALRDHLALNSGNASVHVGIAVDTEGGLVVPVIRDATTLGLRQIAIRSRELISHARERKLRPDEMQGGTFTVTNLGAFGVETFTPIINPPECAILGMGKIERRPVMDGEEVVGRDLMHLSLTFDHRVVDGAPAARFLKQLVQSLENPAPWLMA